MRHSDVPARAPDGQPLCRGYDWTEPAWVPSDLTEERQVGQCSWLESVVDYDDDGDPCESHISHEIRYSVRPDGSAQIMHRIGSDWSREILEPGTWEVAYFPFWPWGFGARSGVQIVPWDTLALESIA